VLCGENNADGPGIISYAYAITSVFGYFFWLFMTVLRNVLIPYPCKIVNSQNHNIALKIQTELIIYNNFFSIIYVTCGIQSTYIVDQHFSLDYAMNETTKALANTYIFLKQSKQ